MLNFATREDYLEEVDRLKKLKPGVEQWRGVIKLLEDVNPKWKELNRGVIRLNTVKKQSLFDPKYGKGTDKNSAIRAVYGIPPGLIDIMRRYDPDFFDWDNTTEYGKRKLLEFVRNFPEYVIPDKPI